MARPRVGVIGAGSWAVSSHLPNLARRRDAGEIELAIVNRRSPGVLARISDDFGFAQSTTEWREVIAAEPDIVVVSSPPGLHHEHAKAALDAGAHVLCEKPFTIDPADAWDLHATAERTGRELFIAYGWNYRPMVLEAARLMREEGGIGEVEQMTMHMDSAVREILSETGSYADADPELLPHPDTWADPVTSGGGYGQAQLTHVLALTLWLTGLRGEAAFALMNRGLGSRVELHDAFALRFDNGAIGSLGGASSHAGAADDRHGVELRVVGARGMLRLDLRADVLWRYRGREDDVTVPLPEGAGVYDCIGPVDAVVDAALGRAPANNSPAELGARTVEILDAAYRSAESGALETISHDV